MMRFQFELVPVDEVEPWGENRNLHWFGLTEGWYCLDVGGVDLLRYSEQTTARRSPTDGRTVPPWAEYYVVRLWEDMLQALPYILEPVPNDLVDFVTAGWSIDFDDIDDAELLDNTQIDAAIDAYSDRSVDTGYLRFGPELQWWRTLEPVDTVNVDWRFNVDPDGDVAFTAPLSGRASVSTDKFVSAITDFDYRLLEAMQVRVDTIAATDVLSGFDLDIPGLIREQAERRTWLSQAMAHQVNTDWDAVRAGASFLTRHSR
ncbi:DUF5984 family protein [Rhodococcus globerulus]|uniref:DUF5984 family protein n=1 Tax=Rhodococcus globerulus TaxID=33008 RepID=UPI001F336561|nr:DUF5984 family protein [Rhodococcus globerulus]MCE4265502.1 hypothetical protein [Rhodococcus globerulus]